MSKRMLMVATVPSMIGMFNMDNIEILQSMHYEVHVACDFKDLSIWPDEKIKEFRKKMKAMKVKCFQIDFSRSAVRFDKHARSLKQVLQLINKYCYEFIHTHTPIASAVVRVAAHRTGTKVIYTAHGFHFYDGAPLKNWMIYYPIEKYLSRYTNIIITINKEDYKRAKRTFKALKTVYVPGVGVDTEKFSNYAAAPQKRINLLKSLDLEEDIEVFLSVGELNENKNHSLVIEALEGIDKVVYLIAGSGKLNTELKQLADAKKVKLRLLGFRNDVEELYKAADLYILPSIREGLNVSLMEAVASGCKCIASDIRGNRDLLNEDCLFDANDKEALISIIHRYKDLSNPPDIKKFSSKSVNVTMKKIYYECKKGK